MVRISIVSSERTIFTEEGSPSSTTRKPFLHDPEFLRVEDEAVNVREQNLEGFAPRIVGDPQRRTASTWT